MQTSGVALTKAGHDFCVDIPALNTEPHPERRQITILQCKLEEATLASGQQDPEELQNLLEQFHKACSAAIAQAGGTVARLLTDGALYYFGYPQADEHQAERAVRAALQSVKAATAEVVGSFDSLHVRVGIATGVVVIGDNLLGASGGLAALGEATGMATKLCGLADPGRILISDATRRLIGNLFRLREMHLGGTDSFARATPFWEVLGEGAVESRFEALRPGPLRLLAVTKRSSYCSAAGRLRRPAAEKWC